MHIIPPHLNLCLSSSKDKKAMTVEISRNINKNLAMDQYMYFSAFSARTRWWWTFIVKFSFSYGAKPMKQLGVEIEQLKLFSQLKT